MEIFIDDSIKLCEIQKVFSKYFPYLKFEFFEFHSPEKEVIKKRLIKNTIKQWETSGSCI